MNSYTILIVDDKQENIALLENTLKNNGYKLIIARNENKAVKCLNEDKPHLLLLGMLNDTIGYNVLRSIKSEKIENIPVIILSERASEDEIIKGFELGAVDYITKPFIITEVLARISNHLKITKYQKLLEMQNQKLNRQTDILKKQKQRADNTNKKLIELNKFKERITNTIVHDLKNPLNLIENKNTDREVSMAVFKMQNLIFNLLNVQKFEESRMAIEPEIFFLPDIIEDAFNQIKYILEEKNIRFIAEIPAGFSVFADKELIARVVINLIHNAVKYTENNGRINVKAYHKSNYIYIEISDTGIGISKTMLSNVFDKFVHTKKKKTSNQYSTGIGLEFCKMAVEAHQGIISVSSEENKGASFLIQLPVEKNHTVERKDHLQTIAYEQKMPELTKSEKAEYKNMIRKLLQLKVYQITDIENVIEEMRMQDISNNTEYWCEFVLRSAKSCNNQLYQQTISKAVNLKPTTI